MLTKFRCEKCKKLLMTRGTAGTRISCPHCEVGQKIPVDMASLAMLIKAGNSVQKPADKKAQTEPKQGSFFGLLAYGMPWVMSAFLHMGVFLIAMFVIFLVEAASSATWRIPVPEATIITSDSAAVMHPGSGGDPNIRAAAPIKSNSKGFCRREGKVAKDASGESGNIDLIGLGGGGAGSGGGLAEFGLIGGGSGSAPKSRFYGSGGQAFQVVYVIDRSGSMIHTFDYLRKEMLVSIGNLKESQDFHVIFFASGTPMENPPMQLVAAGRQNKIMAAGFLKNVMPEGQTDPVPALRRAFDVLQGAHKKGKLIYLLSDGLFPDNEAVLKMIHERNPEGRDQTMICTFLYGQKPPEAEEVMQKIALENRGRYKFITPDLN